MLRGPVSSLVLRFPNYFWRNGFARYRLLAQKLANSTEAIKKWAANFNWVAPPRTLDA